MFGRQRRRHDREVELLRDALDRVASQPSVAMAISDLQKTIAQLLHRSDSAEDTRDTVVAHLWQKVSDQEQGVVTAMQQLVGLFAVLQERLEAQDRQQQELCKVIRVLGQKLELAPSSGAAGGERLIGGSFTAGPERRPDIDIDIDIELTTPDTAVEVKSGFDDHWVDGFEICEAVFDGNDPRYRIRRCADGVVLPELFDAAHTRPAAKSQELDATPDQQRRWSPL